MRAGCVLAALVTACGLAFAARGTAGNPQAAGLQVALRSKGYYHGRIDAIRGPLTRAALIAFQRRAGLVPDAIDGPRTRAALGRLGRPLYGSRYLRRGAVGWDVAVLQFLLRRRGFLPGVPDGRFGRRTKTALVRFQRSRGLRPDGVLGPRTAHVLCSAAPCTFRARPPRRRFARYLVRPGDTLTAIAARYRVSLRAIMRANPRQSANLLLAGSVLRIPLGPLVRAARSEGKRSVRESLDYWAGFYGVDRHLVRAVAWMESGYQQHVVSPVGAQGVMQVAPETWRYVETVLLGRTVPHTMQGNIRVGVAMLRHLLREHGMDRGPALAAYVQGDRSLQVQGMLPVTRMYVADVLALARRL